MYGILTISPKIYLVPGSNSDDSPKTSPILKFEALDKSVPMRYKIKIKNDLVPLFINMEDYNSRNRKERLELLQENNKDFKKWCFIISSFGNKLTGSTGWYSWRYFFLAIDINIVLESNDVEYLTKGDKK